MLELFGASFVSSIRGAPCTSWPQVAAIALKGKRATRAALHAAVHCRTTLADLIPSPPKFDPTSLSDEAVTLAVGPLGILVLHCRDIDHLAVIALTAQPAEKGALEQLGVETIGLGAPVFARYRYARCVDDVGLDAARLEPTCQPEAVAAGLEGHRNALDPASCFLRFLPPSMQQFQQCALACSRV